MTDAQEKDKAPETPEQGTPKPEGKKSNLLKYIIFGVVGLVVIGGIAFGTLMLVGGGKTSEQAEGSTPASADSTVAAHPGDSAKHEEGPAEHAAEAEAAPDTMGIPTDSMMMDDSMFAFLEQDSGVLDDIVATLAVTDRPADTEAESSKQMSPEDSAAEVSWIEQEKARLTKWQAELDSRQKQLDKLDQSVSKKLVRLEQAESARVAQLAKLYDGMDSRAVANLLASLDDSTVVDIIPRMKPKNASAVLQLMPAKRAARLSQQMITVAESK